MMINPQLCNAFRKNENGKKTELSQMFNSVTEQPHRGKYRAFQ